MFVLKGKNVTNIQKEVRYRAVNRKIYLHCINEKFISGRRCVCLEVMDNKEKRYKNKNRKVRGMTLLVESIGYKSNDGK